MDEILEKITRQRVKTIEKKGLNFGFQLQSKRPFPLTLPDLSRPILICEIKRGSPSEGSMNPINDPVQMAGQYVQAGANVISVLTEENFFQGSLADLWQVKQKYPGIPLLRKDFLQFEQELEISYYAGADLVLLIAALFEGRINELAHMKKAAEKWGLLPLIEVHNEKELTQILPLKPRLIGINSRNLKTFQIDKNYPIALKSMIRQGEVIFESGIKNAFHAFFAANSGFNGLLVGSSIVKSPSVSEKIAEIKTGFEQGKNNASSFYETVFKKIYIDKKRLVKICGITRLDDAQSAVEQGADLIGFIFAASPRQITPQRAKSISRALPAHVLKVAVVTDMNAPHFPDLVQGVKDGWLSALQLHGKQACPGLSKDQKKLPLDVCWYQAINVASKADIDAPYDSPFVLWDAFVKGQSGGTGRVINRSLLDYAKTRYTHLYLAGGINPDNVEEMLLNYQPVLIDLCSGLEAKPGQKDQQKMKNFFEKIKAYRQLD